MGLMRVAAVAHRLGLDVVPAPLILVGGTNGKGSTVAMLASIYQQAGYTVGAYTSPHITNFCERICVDGHMVDELAVVEALDFIERGRAPDTLTYFEYTTLAAMRVFNVMNCDVLLFEVGLGGRLDATNIWDADCSIITSIGIDHEAYLGSDVSIIATEKAAIGRPHKPFITGEHEPPASLAAYAKKHRFDHHDVGAMPGANLPDTLMPGEYQKRNAGCAVAAVNALQKQLPVADNIIKTALMSTQVQGRFELTIVNDVPLVLDVAHNPAGAQALVQAWREKLDSQTCDIVFASLADKDIAGVVSALHPIVNTWHCLTLDVPRAANAGELVNIVKHVLGKMDAVEYHDAVDAVKAAMSSAKTNKRAVLVAGSFYTIAMIKSVLSRESITLD